MSTGLLLFLLPCVTFARLKRCKRFIPNNKDLKVVKYLSFVYLTYYEYHQYIVGDIILLERNLYTLKARRPSSVFLV